VKSNSLRPLLAVSFGNALEFYDFTVYAFFAIQIGQAFFPSHDPQISLLASFATFGAGFLTRPLGAVIIGRMGDRQGRGPALALSMVLMGLAIAMLVLCPGYERIGIAAPLVALASRLLQGFALGGEAGPATAYMLEAAPLHRRGLFVAVQRATQLLANLVGAILGAVLAAVLSPEAFTSYGWRIAIGLGALVAPYALYLRRNLPEPPFRETEVHSAATPAVPPGTWRMVLCCTLVGAGGTVSAYVLNYLTTYGQADLHLPTSATFAGQATSCLGGMASLVAGAMISDRIGRRAMIVAGNLLAAVLVPLVFVALLGAPGVVSFVLAATAVGALLNFPTAAVITISTESFPHHVRSLATALAYTVPVTLFGGTTQFAVVWLIRLTGSTMVPALYAAGALLLSSLALVLLRETAPARRGDLPNPGQAPLGRNA